MSNLSKISLPDWIFFDCFNTLIDDFDSTGDESGLGPLLHLPVEAGFYPSETDFKRDYDEWRKRKWTGDEWHEVELPERLRAILMGRDSSREDEIETLVNRMLIPNLDQPATNTKKVSTITDPRKRVSSL